MKQDNRGFTLVELIVCIAIFAIVMLAAFGFMTTGARSYANVDTRITHQLTSQIALNQVADSLINCSAGICTANNGTELYLLDSASGAYTVDAYALADGKLSFGTAAAAKSDTPNADGQTVYTTSVSPSDLVSAKVESFKVVLSATDSGEAVSSAVITLKLTNDPKTYTQTVALRNRPQIINLSKT